MNALQKFLLGTENKTLLVSVLLTLLTFLEGASSLLSEFTVGAIATISAVVLIIMKMFFPTGKLDTGWSTFYYIGNAFIAILGIANVFGDAGWITAEQLTVFTIMHNAIFGAWNMFINTRKATY